MTDLIPINQSPLAIMGQLANEYAARNVFKEYQQTLADQTTRRQKNDLALFSAYLSKAGVTIDAKDLFSKPETWQGVTFGLVDGFRRWLLQESYAIGSTNVRLATVKVYCKLAAKARKLDTSEYALISLVKGYRHAEGRNIDKRRETSRKGPKKADPVSIGKEQAAMLKSQPDTPQGRRDALLMCLLLDHGLRCGEVAALKPEHLSGSMLVFYREKVDKTQTHHLTSDALRAMTLYLEVCTPIDRLFLGSGKSGAMIGIMSTRAITKRVKFLGEKAGLENLSAHDCRHYWATAAVRGGTDIKSLQDAGGWNSPVMPLRYAESGAIANKGVKLG